jgi:hypothetical protein
MSLNGVVLALLLTIPVSLRAQPAAWRDDVKSIDGVMRAYYEVVSGPAGSTPDRARDEFLHHPDALIGMPVRDSSGTETLVTMSLAGFYERAGGVRDVAFYEWEISRRVERFGMIAHVWSTYASSERPDGDPQSRGINSIQLHFDGERWWIMGWIYDRERPGKAIPEEYLKEPGHDD